MISISRLRSATRNRRYPACCTPAMSPGPRIRRSSSAIANPSVVSSVIAGASDPEQLALNAAGASWALDDETLAAVEAVVPAPLGTETLPYALPRR